MAKIEILETRIRGDRLALHVQLDTGERFWYVTTVNRSEDEIKDILRQKYDRIQKTKLVMTETKRKQLKKKFTGMVID